MEVEVYERRKNATRYVYPLSPKKVIKKTVVASIAWLVSWLFFAGLMCWIAYYYKFCTLLEMVIVLIVPAIALIPAIYKYEKLYYETYYYDILPDVLIIRKGVWMPREIRIPYNRIQNVYVDRDFFDVIFGLYDVHLATADNTSQFYAHIDGVDEENAAKLRKIILNKTKESSTSQNSGV